MRFVQIPSDPCIIALYVEDIILAPKTDGKNVNIKQSIAESFIVIDIEELKIRFSIASGSEKV